IEFVALFILGYIAISKYTVAPIISRYKWLFMVNISLIFIARFLLIYTPDTLKKIDIFAKYNDFDRWVQDIKEVAGNHYVVFQDGFQEPSYYNFYTQSSSSFSYNSVFYRKNQYDLWPIAENAFN